MLKSDVQLTWRLLADEILYRSKSMTVIAIIGKREVRYNQRESCKWRGRWCRVNSLQYVWKYYFEILRETNLNFCRNYSRKRHNIIFFTSLRILMICFSAPMILSLNCCLILNSWYKNLWNASKPYNFVKPMFFFFIIKIGNLYYIEILKIKQVYIYATFIQFSKFKSMH